MKIQIFHIDHMKDDGTFKSKPRMHHFVSQNWSSQ